MQTIRVAVVNWTHHDDDWLRKGIVALQQQLDEDFAPVWHLEAELVLVPRSLGRTRYPGHWGLVLLGGPGLVGDESDALSAYGPVTSDGHPLTLVRFDNLHDGQDWTHIASQALLEMLVDPDGNGAVVHADPITSQRRIYAKRICAPCAAYSDGYERAGRQVSDFVYPAWFGSAVLGNGDRFDKRDRIDRPFGLLAGGSIRIVDPATTTWQVLDSHVKPETFSFRKAGWAP